MFPFLGSLPQTTYLVVCVFGGGKLPNTNCDQIKYPKLQLQMIDSRGGGVNYQTQIVTKLPNENIQNYHYKWLIPGGVNDQMQIVTKLPNGTTEVAQNDSKQPILPSSQLFQSFPTKVAQNDSEWPISPDS